MSRKELISGDKLLGKLRTSIGISKTSPNLVPILGIHHVVSKPTGKLVKPVLLVRSSGDIVAAVRPGYDKGKDEDDEKEHYQNGHNAEVEGQESLLVPVSSDEAAEGDQEDKDPEEDHRPPEEMDALVVRLGCKPDSGGYYGN